MLVVGLTASFAVRCNGCFRYCSAFPGAYSGSLKKFESWSDVSDWYIIIKLISWHSIAVTNSNQLQVPSYKTLIPYLKEYKLYDYMYALYDYMYVLYDYMCCSYELDKCVVGLLRMIDFGKIASLESRGWIPKFNNMSHLQRWAVQHDSIFYCLHES